MLFLVFIIKLYLLNDDANYKMEIKATVVKIKMVRGRPLQKTAKLSDGKSIDVPTDLISSIQIGDSIIKTANSHYFMLKSMRRNIYITTEK